MLTTNAFVKFWTFRCEHMRVVKLTDELCNGPIDGHDMMHVHDPYFTTSMGEYDIFVVRDDDMSQHGHLFVVLYDQCEFMGGMSLYLRNYWVGFEKGGWFSAYEPHSFLHPQYRGKGIALALYRWIAQSANMVCNIKHTQAANNIWSKLYDEFNGSAFYCNDDGIWVEDNELDKCEALSSSEHTVVIGPIKRYGERYGKDAISAER